ncbi:MAG: DUF4160 domain-containing protein [Bacteroidetes bacterium]|nr:DUF4160 domain-containing protein [Bacteroidota bacterium]
MPKIYEYMGISIYIYNNDHEPIHVHARYNGNEVKIYRTIYSNVKGEFSPTKLRDLKKFISVFKETIIQLWTQINIWKVPVTTIKITKRI